MQLLAHNFPFAQQTLVEDEDALAKVDTLPLIMRNNHHGILLLPQAARTWSNNTLLPAPSIEPVSLPTSDIISRNPNPSWAAQAITDYEANNAFGGLQRGYTDHGGGPYTVTDMGYYQEPLMSSGDMHMLGHLQVKPEVAEAFNDSMKMGLNLGGRMFFTRDVVSPLLRLGKRSRPNSLCIAQPVLCQVQGCKADLSLVKAYHRRHKVCQLHSKSAIVIVNGITQRFCQQCSRFHGLSEFDEGKRSCRKRLADHNRRRRKPQPRSHSSDSATSDCTQGSSIMAITTSTPIPTTIATNFSTTISDVTTAGIKSSRKVGNVYEEEPNGSEISHLKNCMTDNVNRVGKEQMATKFLHGTNQVQQMQVYGGYGHEGNLLAGSESTSGIEGLHHMGSSLPWKLWSSPTTKGLLPIPESNSNGLLFFLAQEGEACSDNLSLSTQNLVPLYFASSPSPTLNAASSSSSISHDQQYSTTSSSPEWMIQPLPSAHTPPPLEQLQPFMNEFPSTRQNHSQLTHYKNQMFSLFDEERQVEKKVTNDQNKTLSLQPWKLEEAIANNQ